VRQLFFVLQRDVQAQPEISVLIHSREQAFGRPRGQLLTPSRHVRAGQSNEALIRPIGIAIATVQDNTIPQSTNAMKARGDKILRQPVVSSSRRFRSKRVTGEIWIAFDSVQNCPFDA
jgi:hypothetical protein